MAEDLADGLRRNEMSESVKRGFAAMDPALHQAIARLGGAAVPHAKRSFSQDRELAAQAGRKGGLASQAKFFRAK